MKLNEFKPMKRCIVCKEEIFRRNNSTTDKLVRGPKAVTCSPDCSKIYERIQRYIRQRAFYKVKQLQREMKRLRGEKDTT